MSRVVIEYLYSTRTCGMRFGYQVNAWLYSQIDFGITLQLDTIIYLFPTYIVSDASDRLSLNKTIYYLLRIPLTIQHSSLCILLQLLGPLRTRTVVLPHDRQKLLLSSSGSLPTRTVTSAYMLQYGVRAVAIYLLWIVARPDLPFQK